MLWTTYKSGNLKPSLIGKYSAAFCPCNASATNEYRQRKHLAYLISVYPDPRIINWFNSKGITLNAEAYALSQMLQWIWRSAIRERNPITIYIPSERMRNLLKYFLVTGKVMPNSKKDGSTAA